MSKLTVSQVLSGRGSEMDVGVVEKLSWFIIKQR